MIPLLLGAAAVCLLGSDALFDRWAPLWTFLVIKCQYWGDRPPKREKQLKKIPPTPTPGPYKDRCDRGIRVPLAPRGARPIDFYTFECRDTEKVPRGTQDPVTPVKSIEVDWVRSAWR